MLAGRSRGAPRPRTGRRGPRERSRRRRTTRSARPSTPRESGRLAGAAADPELAFPDLCVVSFQTQRCFYMGSGQLPMLATAPLSCSPEPVDAGGLDELAPCTEVGTTAIRNARAAPAIISRHRGWPLRTDVACMGSPSLELPAASPHSPPRRGQFQCPNFTTAPRGCCLAPARPRLPPSPQPPPPPGRGRPRTGSCTAGGTPRRGRADPRGCPARRCARPP